MSDMELRVVDTSLKEGMLEGLNSQQCLKRSYTGGGHPSGLCMRYPVSSSSYTYLGLLHPRIRQRSTPNAAEMKKKNA